MVFSSLARPLTPLKSPVYQREGDGGVGVGVGPGMHASSVSALASVNEPSKPPAAIILLLLPMNAPDVNDRTVFMFAEVVQPSVAGLYTKVLLAVSGTAGPLTRPAGNAALVERNPGLAAAVGLPG